MLWNYTKMMLKSIILNVSLFISLAGIVTVYFTNVKIPYWVFLLFPFIALFYAGYSIYKNSAPSITIIPPDEDDLDIKYDEFGAFKIIMKSRITNFGTRSGSLESIKLNYMGFNGLKDKFLLENLMFTCEEPKILKKKPTPVMSLKPMDFDFKYPIIVDVNKNDYLYFLTSFHIPASGDEGMKEATEWIKTLDFELEYKYKDTHKTYVKKAKVIIDTDKFYDIYQEGKKDREELEEILKNL
ncbi:hypothetical protein [Priestia megaterium]|uniref:hypothetical protein n=1 Tax=Priestia megaterium TaxID=1404 RepID=UPI00301D5406